MFKYYFKEDEISAEVHTTNHANTRILQRVDGEDPDCYLYRCFFAIERDEATLEEFMCSLKKGSKFGFLCDNFYCMVLALEEVKAGACKFKLVTVFNETNEHFHFFGRDEDENKCDFVCAVEGRRVVSFFTK